MLVNNTFTKLYIVLYTKCDFNYAFQYITQALNIHQSNLLIIRL